MAAVKLSDRIRAELEPRLDPDETLLAAAGLSSGGLAPWTAGGRGPARCWWIGLTNRRAILARRNRMNTKIDESGVFDVAVEALSVDFKTLKIATSQRGIPKVLGFELFQGHDIADFKNALTALQAESAPAPTLPSMPPAGWYPDPDGRHEYRYWDGSTWTGHAGDNGATTWDPGIRNAGQRPLAA